MIETLLDNIQALEKVNAFSTCALIGLIWTIQLVHYPSFRFIDTEEFQEFEKFHTQRITFIVGPLMVIELLASIALAFLTSFSIESTLCLGIVILIWLSTLFLSIPCHEKLSTGKDLSVIDKLIKTNWPRTLLWTLKGIILFT